MLARDGQRAFVGVVEVDVTFGDEAQATPALHGFVQWPRSTEHRDAEGLHGVGDPFRRLGIPHGKAVVGAVRLDVIERQALAIEKGFQGPT